MTKSAKAPPPDPNVGLAQREMADIARRSEDRADLNDQFFRENFAPRYLQQMDDQISMGREAQDFSMGLARKYDDRYWNTTALQQDAFYDAVDRYDTGRERDRIAGRAMADVEQQMASGQRSMERGLQRRGINPGSAAYMSMLGDNQRAASLAKAGAATMAQEAARREGLNLRGVAAGLGGNLTGASSGFLGQGLQASGLGMQGIQGAQGGFNANNAQWNQTTGLAGNMYGNVGNLGMQQWQTQANINMQNANSFNNMLGTAIGIGTGFAMNKWG